ncbi:MAG: permease-like cell division protein FtsX [Candidatus Latescibacterota bacterium]
MGYALRAALSSLRHAGTGTVLSVGTIALSLFVLGIFLLITFNLYGAVEQLRARVEVEIFLKDKAAGREIASLEKTVSAMPEVLEVRHVTKEMAAREFQTTFGEDLLEAVPDNPLPASLRIHLTEAHRTAEGAERVAKAVRKASIVEEVAYGQTWVQQLDRLILIFFAADLVVGIAIASATLLVIANTIKLAVLGRRESIEIMRLVGATDAFIRRPFFFEGLFQGFLGGLLAGIAIALLHRVALLALPHLVLMPGRIPALTLVVVGTLLGAIGSQRSLRHVLDRLG